MEANALAMPEFRTTAPRPLTVARGRGTISLPSGARIVESRKGFILFDEWGRYLGVVAMAAGTPVFGSGADTVLLRR